MKLINSQYVAVAAMFALVFGALLVGRAKEEPVFLIAACVIFFIAFLVVQFVWKKVWFGFCFLLPIMVIGLSRVAPDFQVLHIAGLCFVVIFCIRAMALWKLKPQDVQDEQYKKMISMIMMPSEIVFFLMIIYAILHGMYSWYL